MTEEAIDFQLKYLENVPEDYEQLLERLQDCVIELQEKQLEFEELQGNIIFPNLRIEASAQEYE